MSAAVFIFPVPGTPTGLGYQLSFFEAGTSTPVDVFTDVDLSVAWSQPIVFNADGEPDSPIFLSPSPDLKIVYEDDNSVAVPGYPFDDYAPYSVAGDLPATNITGALSVTGNTTITGTLAVSSGVTFSSTLAVSGAITATGANVFGASTLPFTAAELIATGSTGSSAAAAPSVYPAFVNCTATGVSGAGINLPTGACVTGAFYTIFNQMTGVLNIYGVGATINGTTGTTPFALSATGNRMAIACVTTAGAWLIRGNT